jgi:4-hydroxy-4-methyl-2-oxoglutarate aldolase
MTSSVLSSSELQELAKLGVATVYEASGREGLIDLELHRIVPGSRVAGPARTVLCAQGDNLMMHAVLAVAQPGEIIVLTMPEAEPVGLVGELLATQALGRGVAGLLIDAAVRDVDELREMGLPIWSRFIRARGAKRDTLGTLNVPVLVGGTTIRTGDILVLDGDGAVVIAAERAQVVLEASRARAVRESELRKKFESGVLSIDLYSLRGMLEDTLENGTEDHA